MMTRLMASWCGLCGQAIAARLSATPAKVLMAWQIRIGVSINPRSISAAHQQDALDALELVPLFTADDLAVLMGAPQVTGRLSVFSAGSQRRRFPRQIWCSVVPENYQCAPDEHVPVLAPQPPPVLAAPPAPPPPYETVHAATFEPSKPATIQQQVIPNAGGQVREGDPPANGYVAIIDNAAAHFGVCERDRLAWMDARAFASR